MDTATPGSAGRSAIAIDIDRPFQHVLAAWLAARGFHVDFVTLPLVPTSQPPPELIVCELAEPKATGAQILHELAQTHPDAVLVAISPRLVAGARWDTLARQLGADAALGKPFSRDEFLATLDAAFRNRFPLPP